MNNKKGISLIVLVITILVMIILAGVVIVSLQNDNPINKAKFAKMVDSVQSVRSAISQYAVTKQASSANQTGDTNLDSILTTPAVSGGTYDGWKPLKSGAENAAALKKELGVDPTSIKGGTFYVNPKTGASVFQLEDATYATEANGVDGIIPAGTIK